MKFKILISLSLFFLASTACAQRPPKKEDPCAVLPTVLVQTSELRKLPAKKEVPCVVQNKDQIEKYILSQIDSKLRPNQMKHEELILKAIGFFPEKLDYEKSIIDLYLSQLAGYYDPDKDRFVMASWIPSPMQAIVAVHELTHALQDQHYNLGEVIKHQEHSSDLQLARAALIEGDATALMLDYAMHNTKQKSLAEMDEDEIEKQSAQIVDSAKGMSIGEYGGIEHLLVFPYAAGLKFAHKLIRQGGYDQVNQAFKRLPRSTEEVLHFKKYQDEDPDFKVFTDEQVLKEVRYKKQQVIFSDTYGEYFIKAWLLTLGISEAQAGRAAAGWGGDRILISSDPKTKKRFLVWKLSWDTIRDADQFFGAASPALQQISEKRPNRNLQLKKKDLDIYLISDL